MLRSIRYPGLISWKAAPGGGTTDYAIHIFHEALKKGSYASFLSATTELPMMYMDDAIRGTIELMDAPADKITIRSSYNFAGISFTPEILATEIRKHIPDFKLTYAENDPRQEIANSWPKSVDDHFAKKRLAMGTKVRSGKNDGRHASEPEKGINVWHNVLLCAILRRRIKI
jgi:nucleoside-diphosphate-sugar epimerase